MRNISFMLTIPQVRARTKTVTRRMGWGFLGPSGDLLQACEKCQGLGKNGKIVKLGTILVRSKRAERLDRMITEPEYGAAEVIAEGFPEMTPAEFVDFFCKSHKKCTPASLVTRIQFDYL